MSDRTSIEWTRGDDGTAGATWNPVTGCTKVSPGCDRCYAETFAERWRGTPGHYFENGFDVQLRPDKLNLPLTWRKPRRVFVNSMSDLFHDAVPVEFIIEVLAVMASVPRHTFQLLTKRHARMRSLLGSDGFRQAVQRKIPHVGDDVYAARHSKVWPLPNVWVGVSVEDQKWADIRIPALLETPAAVRFLSCEPLLGPVDLSRYLGLEWSDLGLWLPEMFATLAGKEPDLHWVIAGGESGHGARPMDPAWVRPLRDQCAAAEVPFFMKQAGSVLAREWGCSDRKGHDPAEWPEPFPREFPAVNQ